LYAAVGAELIALGQLAWVMGGSEDNNGCKGSAGVGPDSSKDVESVHLGELEGQQHEARKWRAHLMAKGPTTEHEVEGLLTIPNHLDPVSAIQLPKWLEGELDLERTMFDQKDVGWKRGGCPLGGWEAGRLGSHDACASARLFR
jgi:hypothetical protein